MTVFLLDSTAKQLQCLGVRSIAKFDAAKDALPELQNATENGVLICDVYMPHMDGIEVLKALQALNYKGHVILISGVNEEMLENASKLGGMFQLKIAATMRKPIRLNLLNAVLSRIAAGDD